MNTAVDFDGQIVKAENLLRLSDAQKEFGYSRQSLLLWSKGEGRGKDEPLKLLYLFGGLPHIDREYFEGWVWRTRDNGNNTNERASVRRRNTANKRWLARLEDVDDDQIIDGRGMTKRDLREQVRAEEGYIAKSEADLAAIGSVPVGGDNIASSAADNNEELGATEPETAGTESTSINETLANLAKAVKTLSADVAELKQAKK